jgi:hypothetical protein
VVERNAARFVVGRVRYDCLAVLLDFPQTSTRPRRSGSNSLYRLHDSKSVLVDGGCSLSHSRFCDCSRVMARPGRFVDRVAGDRIDSRRMPRIISRSPVQIEASRSRSSMNRLLYLMLLCLAFALQAPGQTPSTYNTGIGHGNPVIPTVQSELPNTLPGVVIESWHYDAQQKTLTLHLVNRSHKDVTAFNISIAEKYADGSTDYADGRQSGIHDHQKMEDLLGAMISFQSGDRPRSGMVAARSSTGGKDGALQEIMRQQMIQTFSGNGTFAAGTSRDVIDFVSKDVSDIDAVVDVVAYADGTAQVIDNDRAFRNLVAERKGPLLAMEKVTEVVKRVLAEPMVMSPLDAAIRELTPLVDAAETKHGPPEDPESNAAMHLQMDVKNLQMMQQSAFWTRMNMTEREWLTRYVEQQEKRIALMKPHSDVVVIR